MKILFYNRMSEVTYKVWSWDDETSITKLSMYGFIKEKRDEGYQVIINNDEYTGYSSGYELNFFRGSIIYYKAVANDKFIEMAMHLPNILTISVTVDEVKGHNGPFGTWHIDDDNSFQEGLQYLSKNLENMLNAGYVVISNTLVSDGTEYADDDEDEDEDEEPSDNVETTISIELRRSSYAMTLLKPIIAEKERKEKEQRLILEEAARVHKEKLAQQERLILEEAARVHKEKLAQQERARQNKVVESALSIFEPTVNRTLEYANLVKRGGYRSRRNKRKNRKTRNKKRS